MCVWGGCFIDLFFFKTEVIFWFCSQSEVAEEFFFIYFIFYIYYNFLLYIFALLKALNPHTSCLA